MTDELGREQAHLDRTYARLDELRARARQRLAEHRSRYGDDAGGTHQAGSERDVLVAHAEGELHGLEAVEARLYFGRLDLTDGTTLPLGRRGVGADDGDVLLVDWRAPVAQPYYAATPGDPQGVRRRRHIATLDRRVTSIEDELLDAHGLAADDGLVGEAALMAAVTAPRSGEMADIVATIQRDQDRIIRSPLAGTLVVQGGPGTGKTAVALHRAAYLLYTYRRRLGRGGVLLVGPSDRFLRYVARVLPSLGEDQVVHLTPERLVPGIEVTGVDHPATAALKGDLRMVDVLAGAVRAHQRVPAKPLTIGVGAVPIVLDAALVRRARAVARRTGLPHNRARKVFRAEVVDRLAVRAAEAGIPLEPEELVDRVAGLEVVGPVLDALWPPLTPAEVLTTLFTDRRLRDQVADGRLEPGEADLLARAPGEGWTVADVALLDEAAELLGEHPADPSVAAARAEERRRRLQYAEEVTAITGVDALVDAEVVMQRYEGEDLDDEPRLADAAGIHTWRYGHVIVDEAQDLSPMAWRAVVRRCPSYSMTVVGDLDQTTAPGAAAGPWDRRLEPHVADRVRVEHLAVNYRTPEEVMATARAVLPGDGEGTPRAVRRTGSRPVAVPVAHDGLAAEVVRQVGARRAAPGEGQLAVIAADGRLGALRSALADAELVGEGSAVAVLSPGEAKGLEFDTVVVVAPDEIVAASRRGHHALYVALTRTTTELVVVHAAALAAAVAATVDVAEGEARHPRP